MADMPSVERDGQTPWAAARRTRTCGDSDRTCVLRTPQRCAHPPWDLQDRPATRRIMGHDRRGATPCMSAPLSAYRCRPSVGIRGRSQRDSRMARSRQPGHHQPLCGVDAARQSGGVARVRASLRNFGGGPQQCSLEGRQAAPRLAECPVADYVAARSRSAEDCARYEQSSAT